MIIFISIIFLILFLILLLRILINKINLVHKYIFFSKDIFTKLVNKKKLQQWFYLSEKYNEQLLISGDKYLKINNYIFKIENLKKFSYKISKYIILILYNKKSKFLKYKLNNKKYQKPLSNNSVNFIKIKSDYKKVSIKKDDNSKIINTFFINKNKKKLVLILFVDGLSEYLSQHLSNSLNFFGNSNKLRNFYSNSAWTLPTFGNLITGQYTSNHLNYTPISYYKNKKKFSGTSAITTTKTIFEYFKEKDFVTGCYSPYARINPTYSFDRGVDVFKFCENSSSDEMVDKIISQIEFFKESSNFIFAHIFDSHHKLKGHDRIADFIYQGEKNFDLINLNKIIKEKKNYKALNEKNNKKLSIFLRQKNFSEELEIYNRMKLIDFRLQRLYDYLTKKKFNDYTIVLMGDHGTRLGSLNCTGNILDKFHQNVGFFIKDNKVKNFKSKQNKIIETIDLFPSLISRYGNEKNKLNKMFDGKNTLYGKFNKKNSISESLYNEYKKSTSEYNLLINYKNNYQMTSYLFNKNIITKSLEKKFYDKNQNEIKNINKFLYKTLSDLEKNHFKNIRLKNFELINYDKKK